MKIISLVFFSYFILREVLLGQYAEPKKLNLDWDLGVIVESSILFLDKTAENNLWTNSVIDTTTNYYTSLYPISIYLSGRLNFTNRVNFEFRPGLFFGGEEYFGLEFGFFIRYQLFLEKLFLAGGINFHMNSGAAHNGVNGSDETFYFYGLNCGINMSKKLAFMISYYYQPKRKWLYNTYGDYIIHHNLRDIIKFGFNLTF